mgnify:CR=1 FL=1
MLIRDIVLGITLPKKRRRVRSISTFSIEPAWLEKSHGDVTLNANARWAIIEAMIKEFGLTSHHTRSFERFVDEEIPQIIEKFPRIDAQVGVFFDFIVDGEVKVIPKGEEVQFTPLECRWKELTYALPILSLIHI